MELQSRSFLLPSLVTVISTFSQISKILYYTDCVFNPHVFNIDYKIDSYDQNKEKKIGQIEEKKVEEFHKKYRINMDFRFLAETTKTNPNILNNIGMINFLLAEQQNKKVKKGNEEDENKQKKKKQMRVVRLGILVTNENGDIYISLIQ